MQVAGIMAHGEAVELLEVDGLGPPAADEVVLDVATAGIGNWDELVRIGSWQLGGPPPMALGTEAAGTVVAVGSRVTEVRDGDELMTHPLPLRRHGTWAGKLVAPAATVAPRPRAASWEASGAFPIPALTAAQALDEALGIESDGWVVVNGAGGVTGGMLVQLAAARGARVIATTSAKKADRIRDYGASEVLDYNGDWPALARELTFLTWSISAQA
jgi:NADPH:quinone reductase-like Zn-dependent oxidoreductase